MLNNLMMMYMIMIIVSSIFTISSNNWLASWFGLEMNMISFIPLMFTKNNLMQNESMLKYFIIQALASSLFLMINLINATNLYTMNMDNISYYLNITIMMSLMLKLGMAPFQSWFISMSEYLASFQCMILFTWQKLAPMFLIYYLNLNIILIKTLALMSILFSAVGIFNQNSIRKMLAYSSLNNMGWMMLSMMMKKNLLTMYLMIYSMIIIPIMILLNKLNIKYMNNMINLKSMSMTISFSLMFLSLGGLPPLLGFLPKWLIIQYMMEKNFTLMMITTVVLTLYILYIYMQMIMNYNMMNFYFNKWTMKMNMHFFKNKINMMNIMNILGLMLFYII